jgi:putative alpha-1,2-mannosidase
MTAKFSHIILFIVVSSISVSCQNDDFSNLNNVDPFIGTGGHGHTYPGAVSTFGMIQLSPDTDMKGWDWCSGYHYSDSSLMGFSHTHLSGTGWSDLGDILLMPTVGDIKINPGPKENPDLGYRSRFTHQEESASPGYYQVYLQDYKINVELTASDRVGFHRYTYPESKLSNIIIDPVHKIFGSTIKTQIAIEGNTVSGYCFSKGWGGDRCTYFVAEFSKPIERYGIYNGSRKINDANFAEGDSVKAFVQFNTGSGEQIVVKVAISAVSLDGAKLMVKEMIHSFLEEHLKPEKMRQIIGLDKESERNTNTMFEIIMYIYKKQYGRDALTKWILENGFERERQAVGIGRENDTANYP